MSLDIVHLEDEDYFKKQLETLCVNLNLTSRNYKNLFDFEDFLSSEEEDPRLYVLDCNFPLSSSIRETKFLISDACYRVFLMGKISVPVLIWTGEPEYVRLKNFLENSRIEEILGVYGKKREDEFNPDLALKIRELLL